MSLLDFLRRLLALGTPDASGGLSLSADVVALLMRAATPPVRTLYLDTWGDAPESLAELHRFNHYTSLHELYRCNVAEPKPGPKRYFSFQKRLIQGKSIFIQGSIRELTWNEVLEQKAQEVRLGQTISVAGANAEVTTATYSILPD